MARRKKGSVPPRIATPQKARQTARPSGKRLAKGLPKYSRQLCHARSKRRMRIADFRSYGRLRRSAPGGPMAPEQWSRDETPPYANIFPLLEGEDLRGLSAASRPAASSIRLLYEGKVLDGRNRWNACKAAGVEPRFREFDPAADGDPLEFVVVTNLHRRHLTPSQCAMVGADLATMRQGARTDLGQPSASLPEVSQAQASKLATSSERSVRSAVLVKKEGSRDLIQAVRAGKIAVNLAAKLATAPEAIQRRAVAEPERAHVLVKQAAPGATRGGTRGEAAGVAHEESTALSMRTRRGRGAAYSQITGMDRAPIYPTMDLDAIKALNVAVHRRARFRAVPVGDRANAAPGARGHGGLGIRVPHEVRLGEGPRRDWLLESQSARAASRRRQGRRPGARPGSQWPSLIEAPVGEHSRKPDEARRMIEAYFPTLPRIELFARGEARPGWDTWGLEAERPRG